jgi:hypothetical protein
VLSISQPSLQITAAYFLIKISPKGQIPTQMPQLQIAELLLLASAVEPKARRIVSAEYCTPSGAIPVLAAIAFRAKDALFSVCSADIYEARIAAPTLVRYYIGTLIRLKLVQVEAGKRRTLRPTLAGLAATQRYEREMREGCSSFGKVRPMRVLTNSVPW